MPSFKYDKLIIFKPGRLRPPRVRSDGFFFLFLCPKGFPLRFDNITIRNTSSQGKKPYYSLKAARRLGYNKPAKRKYQDRSVIIALVDAGLQPAAVIPVSKKLVNLILAPF
ncbi:MAG: hypothetical protein CVV21_06630 [Candidatus Goldiibacteriota bacterium HGW-Goldbacteria-1]|jgi:hypothetical protein|nr:MAG: hypothetical protein CVV21_06630 [Candidatus Goldiibacteriota bacterium HGW-Goldbacteria-1]